MRISLVAILIIGSLAVNAQTYTVIHIIGKIQDTSTGKYLARGMKIGESTTLKFETSGAKAAMLGASRGRYVVQEGASASSKSDLVYTLSSVISPARGKLSTRAGGINNKLDFEKYFEEPVAVLGDSFSIKVSANAYPMNESKFFYAQYDYQGEKINKKLSNEGDNLMIVPAEFFSVDGNAIAPEDVSGIKLFYFKATSQESQAIADLNLSVVSLDELQSIAEQLDNETEGILEVINSLYGKCNEEYLVNTLATLDQ